ncbi:MAG: DUF401 family protein [Synergistaceae bacterium]
MIEWITPLLYLIYVLGIMICVGIIKEHNLFSGLYHKLSKLIKNKKILVFLYSLIGGILPVPGRCVISASLLDTIATKDKQKRQVFGLVDYLSTHHYYFWSPLEKTVIIPMAALSLTYLGFLKLIWPLLVTYLIFLFIYLVIFLKEDSIEFDVKASNVSVLHIVPFFVGIIALICGVVPWVVFGIMPIYYIIVTKTFNLKRLRGYVNWRLLLFLAIVLIAAKAVAVYISPLFVTLGAGTLVMALIIGWLLAFVMGSSSKFAGLVVAFCSAFGVLYLPLFFASEFSAYLVSPTHKCIIISKEYFGTKLSEFYSVISLLAILILMVGIITTIIV